MTFIPQREFLLDIAQGEVDGHRLTRVLGRNILVGTTPETIWPDGGRYVFPAVAATMTLSSDSALDTAAGTGARTILIEGVTAGYVEDSEIVTLSGLLGVTTTKQWLRINALTVVTAGVLATNQGVVYVGTGAITLGRPAVVTGLIDVGDGVSQMGIYSVPIDKTAYIFQAIMSSDEARFVEFTLDAIAGGVRYAVGSIGTFQEALVVPVEYSAQVPGGSDLEWIGQSSQAVSAATTILRMVEVDT